jgi:glycerol-3-phosphate dehydrogenase
VATVLVLGAGINGTMTARELVLHGIDTVLVDSADLASGTTAYSSRLIHGGLRYLEYGDTALVRESLVEREILLRLAPAFVRPLEFRVPTSSRVGGAVGAAVKFLFGKTLKGAPPRGAWLVRFGLWWYARLVGESAMPRPCVLDETTKNGIGLAPRYRTVLSYYDAQIPHPERFVAALAADARRASAERGVSFRVHTYADVSLAGDRLLVRDALGREPTTEYRPDAVVNAGGPWVDAVLRRLGAPESRLIAGTKGSHILTFHEGLRRAIGDAALYVEAADGRPVFVLPFGAGTLVGTTDLRYDGDPAAAVASEPEIEYLVNLVNGVLPGVRLSRSDVALHYAGVRPLPRSDASTPAAISRRHAIVEESGLPWPAWSLVGGKLTTCRQFAEDAVAVVAPRLGIQARRVSRERAIPDPFPAGDDPRAVVREGYVRRLDDLVERRLMLLFEPRLDRTMLERPADALVAERVVDSSDRDDEIRRVVERLREHFGRAV